jgi:hypothetical protein
MEFQRSKGYSELMMDAVNSFEIWHTAYQTTWCNIPEDSLLGMDQV